MRLDELRELRDAILAHPDMEVFARNVAHVISYLISEQEKRELLNKSMDNLRNELNSHQKNMAEVAFDIRIFKERSARNSKLLMTVLGSMLSILAIEILRLALHVAKP